jgi:hypothetical protein
MLPAVRSHRHGTLTVCVIALAVSRVVAQRPTGCGASTSGTCSWASCDAVRNAQCDDDGDCVCADDLCSWDNSACSNYVCPAGQEYVGRACVNCAAGQTSEGAGSSCASCPAGQSSCSDCGVGKYMGSAGSTAACINCDDGKYAPTASSACIACEEGRFLGGTGAACSNCAVGKKQPATGSTECINCPPGQDNDALVQIGEETFGNTACTGCAAGKFSPGATSCSACPAGQQHIAARDTCELCASGRQHTAARTSCIVCAAGYYSSTDGGATACPACPIGKWLGDAERPPGVRAAQGV